MYVTNSPVEICDHSHTSNYIFVNVPNVFINLTQSIISMCFLMIIQNDSNDNFMYML